MEDRFWTKSYPKGINSDVDNNQYNSLTHFFDETFAAFAKNEFSTNMGVTHSYSQMDDMARNISAWLQSLDLPPRSKIALMMPNVNQYLPILIGVLRAGHVLTSVNPLYTARELKFQLADSDAKVIFILEPFCETLEKVVDDSTVEHVVISKIGDMLGSTKGKIVNFAAKYVKKAVPSYTLKSTAHHTVQNLKTVVAKGKKLPYTRPVQDLDDVVFLQYTGGTTGVAKGILITHRNIISAAMQFDAWFAPMYDELSENTVINAIVALPLYHIFAFIVTILGMRRGYHFTLITNPRDIDGFVKTLAERPFHIFPGVNTLFQALLNHPDFNSVDFSQLKISMAGGMAATPATAAKWREVTGCTMLEGWGMSETLGCGTASPLTSTEFSGNIGLPLPGVDISIRDDDGKPLGINKEGELCIKGANVISGYHNLDNSKFFTEDGFLKTGDVAAINEQGFIKLFDRKKDMLIISGFNVYPNEVEGVLSMHPKVNECAVVGLEDEEKGQSIKAFVVKSDDSLTEKELMDHCKENLTGYKRPRVIEFIGELPKSTVGKILRNELREKTPTSS